MIRVSPCRSRQRMWLCATTGLALASLTPSARAQDAAAPGMLEEVIVTAQKRRESIQDVPVAVSALTGESLSENNVRTLEDLSASVPGFTVAANVNYGSAPMSIRGVGGANGGGNVFADEPVATYADDAFVGRLRMSTADLVDVGSVEVLRGPQGTLYGRNSTAGAVLLRSAAPTEPFQAYLNSSYASFDEKKLTGAVSGALNEDASLTGRAAFGWSDRNGWAKNSVGGRLGGGDSFTGRLYLRAQPADGLTVDLIGEFIKSHVEPATIAIADVSGFRDAVSNPTGTNLVRPYTPRPGLDALVDDRSFAQNRPSYSDVIGRNATLKLEWDLDSVVLNSVSNYREWDLKGYQDSDGTAVTPPLPAFVTGTIANVGDNDGHLIDSQWSQELRLSSGQGAALDWILGAFLYHEDNRIDPIRIRNWLAGPGGAGTEVTFNAHQKTDSWALFADASYDLTSALTLKLGGRYSHEEKDFTNSQKVTTLNQFDPPGPTFFAAGATLAAPPLFTTAESWNNFSPRAVLQYKFTDKVMAYGSYSKGFKSGGFNAFGLNAAFKPETIEAFEGGVKSTLLDGAARLNLAAFHYDYRNLQVRTPVPTGGVGIETADAATSKGFEIESIWYPVEGLRLDANLAYLDAKFDKGSVSSVQVDSFVFGTNPPVVKEDISGNRLTRAPKWQLSLNARQDWELDVGALSAQVGYRYQSSVFFLETQQNKPTYRGDGWSTWDARIALKPGAGNWELAAFVQNITDERHFSQVTSFFGLPNAALNEPRKIGVQVNWKY